MNMQELNELDFSNIGDWPAVIKAILILILAGAVGTAWYFLDTEQAKAANLEAYRAQLAEMEESFGAMLRQLPNRTEVADLLVDVSQTGLAAGLEFELFQPQAEVPKDFYAELPIKIRVVGTYHEFGEFVSGLAALPRIVTIHDVQISPRQNKPGELLLEALARTYRYLDEAGG